MLVNTIQDNILQVILHSIFPVIHIQYNIPIYTYCGVCKGQSPQNCTVRQCVTSKFEI